MDDSKKLRASDRAAWENRVLAAIAEAGSLAKAAVALGISVDTCRRWVHELESSGRTVEGWDARKFRKHCAYTDAERTVMRRRIEDAMERFDGFVDTAARDLGMSTDALRYWLQTDAHLRIHWEARNKTHARYDITHRGVVPVPPKRHDLSPTAKALAEAREANLKRRLAFLPPLDLDAAPQPAEDASGEPETPSDDEDAS